MEIQSEKREAQSKLAMTNKGEEAAAATAATTATTAADKEEEESPTTPHEEGEKPECGFCVFMKAGGCAEAFEAWSRCVDSAREAEKEGGDGEKDEGGAAAASSPSEDAAAAASSATPDFATRCRDATMALQKCMEEHRDYYRDFLADAEEAVAEKMEREGEGEKDEKEEGKKA